MLGAQLRRRAAAADSESEGIWAMMATAGAVGERESGARYHLIRVIIGMERTSQWMEGKGRELKEKGGEQCEEHGRGRGRRSGNCSKTTSFSTTIDCYDLPSERLTTFHSTVVVAVSSALTVIYRRPTAATQQIEKRLFYS